MPYTDKAMEYADADAETTVGTHYSDVFDAGAAGDARIPPFIIGRIATTCTSGGSATVQFQLQTDTEEDFSDDPQTLIDSGEIAVADLVKGYKIPNFNGRFPAGLLQYSRIAIIIGTAALTAGAWTFKGTFEKQDGLV